MDVEVLSAAHRDPASWRLEPASLQRRQPYDCYRLVPDCSKLDRRKIGVCLMRAEFEIVALDSVAVKACESGLVCTWTKFVRLSQRQRAIRFPSVSLLKRSSGVCGESSQIVQRRLSTVM